MVSITKISTTVENVGGMSSIFQGQDRGKGASDCPGPPLRSTSPPLLMTSLNPQISSSPTTLFCSADKETSPGMAKFSDISNPLRFLEKYYVS